MIPADKTLVCGVIWMLLGAIATVAGISSSLWILIGLCILMLCVFDLILTQFQPIPSLRRKIPGRFALGVEKDVQLTLSNEGKRSLAVQFHEGLPSFASCQSFPKEMTLQAQQDHEFSYPVKFLKRGSSELTQAQLRILSPLKLWWRKAQIGEAEAIHIYPDYEPVVRYALLAVDDKQSQMGIHQRQNKGASREFHQLREYQDGDVLQQIDWKASARQGELISREYREERDQSVILLIDSGRRMRSLDGNLSQFDHCLNASLLLSYIALKQGDHVGIQCFGSDDRWLPPVKGQAAMPRVLNHLYDLQTSLAPSDFSQAAQQIMMRQKRRSLVILVTNLRGDDDTELLPAVQMMSKRHVVLVATLREKGLATRATTKPTNLPDALEVCTIREYFEEREKLKEALTIHRVRLVDATAQDLPTALVNGYLNVKRRGLL